jgi:virulence-associated protein VagC
VKVRARKQGDRSSRRATARRAKIFWTGRSQALRLPKEFRFVTREVLIHREGRRVVLEPCEIDRDAKGWPTAWWQLAGSAPEFEVGDRSGAHERGDVLRGR